MENITKQAGQITTDDHENIFGVWLTTAQAAVRLGVSERTLRRWRTDNKISMSATKTVNTDRGAQVFYDPSHLDKIIEERLLIQLGRDGATNGYAPRRTSHVTPAGRMTLDETEANQGHQMPAIFNELKDLQMKYTEQLSKEKAKNASKRTTIFFFVPILLLTITGLSFSSWKAYNFYLTNQKNITEYQDEKQNLISTYKEELNQKKQEYIKTTTFLNAKIDSLNENITTKQIEIENLKQVIQQLKNEK